jgi:hypothetical protein
MDNGCCRPGIRERWLRQLVVVILQAGRHVVCRMSLPFQCLFDHCLLYCMMLTTLGVKERPFLAVLSWQGPSNPASGNALCLARRLQRLGPLHQTRNPSGCLLLKNTLPSTHSQPSMKIPAGIADLTTSG